MAGVLTLTAVMVDVRAFSSRSVIGRRDTWRRVTWVVTDVEAEVHTVPDIAPGEPVNMASLLAFECIQASPQSVCLNDFVS